MDNILKKSRLSYFLVLLTVVFVGDCFGMRMTAQQKKMLAGRKLAKQHENQYFMCEEGTNKGIWVDQELVEKNSQMVQDMIEDVGSKPTKIELPFSIDTIKLIFGQQTYNSVSFDQLKDAIKCIDYLGMKYSENYPPSEAFVDACVYWINSIGNKLIDLGIEMNESSQNKGRSIEEIEKDLPDYTIFKQLNDPFLAETIISKLFLLKDNILQGYTRVVLQRGKIFDMDEKEAISRIFNLNGSIIDLLNVIYNKFLFETRQQQEK